MQACSSRKYLTENQAIVKKVTIDSVDKRFEEQVYNYIQKDQRPASKFSINVPLYNLVNTKNGRYKTSNIKPFGSPPTILDSTLVEISRTQIQKFLKSKGYFKAKVTAEIEVANKIAKVKFKTEPGPAYIIKKIGQYIPDPKIAALYEAEKKKRTYLVEGMQYDDDSLSLERESIYNMMKVNGYYYFLRPYVNYDVRGWEVASNTNEVDVRLNILNPENDTHKQYVIDYTHIIIAPNSDGFPDSIRYKLSKDTIDNKVIFTDFSKRFKPNPIMRYDFLEKGEQYDIRNENLTYDRLYELSTFKNVKISYFRRDSASNKINAAIQLLPQKIMSNRIEGEVPFNAGTVGFNISNTFTNNNLFRGAERFQLQVKGGLQSRTNTGKGLFSDIYQRDFSISASITVPRLIIPFYDPKLGSNGMPHTTFASSYIFAQQKDVLTRRIFINSITYDWTETKSKLHTLTPLNIEYRLGNIQQENIDPSIQLNNQYYIDLLGRKDFTLGTKYTYALNTNKLNQHKSFVFFRGNIEIAGNTLQGISALAGNKHNPDNFLDADSTTRDYGTFLGVPYNQYVRPEIDIRWYKHISGERYFVARVNTGIGYAYGNSVTIPFEKKFFAGGSTGIRAWQARTLGPGGYNRGVLSSEEERTALYGLDQLGDMRIETNFEFRFLLSRKFIGGRLNGASFVDMGNIWNITKDPNDADAEIKMFKFSKLAQQLAIGTGVGFRYDVDYFVFRFDIGLKIRDPQFSNGDEWVIKKFFSGGRDFKNDFNATHKPDTYQFVQYNFGIGLPF
ncbi:BamA/TamA family outer membrane protein [Pedobacter sp. MW01-1-1]